jgi:hypothetical protein
VQARSIKAAWKQLAGTIQSLIERIHNSTRWPGDSSSVVDEMLKKFIFRAVVRCTRRPVWPQGADAPGDLKMRHVVKNGLPGQPGRPMP